MCHCSSVSWQFPFLFSLYVQNFKSNFDSMYLHKQGLFSTLTVTVRGKNERYLCLIFFVCVCEVEPLYFLHMKKNVSIEGVA